MSGTRAALRVAAKNAIRNRRRTVFIVLLVAIPVAVGVVVAGIVRATSFTPEEHAQLKFGAADVEVTSYPSDSGLSAWITETMLGLDPAVQLTEFRRVGIALEDYAHATATDIDIGDPVTEGMYLLLEGRAPAGKHETAVSPAVAENLGVEIGDQVTFEDLGLGTLDVVGYVSQPIASADTTILLPPAALEGHPSDINTFFLVAGDGAEGVAGQLEELWWTEGRQRFLPEPAVDPKPAVLAEVPDELYLQLTESQISQLVEIAEQLDPEQASVEVNDRAWEMAQALGHDSLALAQLAVETRTDFLSLPRFEENSTLLATAASALLLVEVAFITGAAFAAGIRRRLREIGLLSANGASEKHVRATVIGEGITLGILGSAVGVVIGIGVLLLGRSVIQRFAERVLTGFGVSAGDIAGPVLVALVSIVVAVWIPAKTASKVPTTTALQGRMPSSSPKKWTVPVGAAITAAGTLLITVALASASRFAPAMVAVGAVLGVGGVAMLASPILAGVSKLADYVPASSRLVFRDAGRHRTRASVAVAAIMVILLGPFIFVTMSAMNAKQNLVNGLPEPENHLLLSGAYDQALIDPQPIDDTDIAALAAIVPERSIATFKVLDIIAKTREQLALEAAPESPNSITYGAQPVEVAVASDSLLAALDHPDLTRAITADQVVVLGIEDKNTVVSLNGEEWPAIEVTASVMKWRMPRILISPSTADQLRATESMTMALFVLERSLTSQEQAEMWHTLSLETNGGQARMSDSTVYLIAAGVTLVVVLLVIALVTAVSAAEVDEELQTIVAVGAPGSFRRRFLGLLTTYQTLIAAALALPLGLGLIKVFTAASPVDFQGPFGQVSATDIPVPWMPLIGIAVALPVIVGALTWISVRSARVTPPRRAT